MTFFDQHHYVHCSLFSISNQVLVATISQSKMVFYIVCYVKPKVFFFMISVSSI